MTNGAGSRQNEPIPDATVARLPVYLRGLVELSDEDVATVSSVGLADRAGVNAANVRKDMSYLHAHGTRGVGYDVDHLIGEISVALGGGVPSPVVIVGVGNLGRALSRYDGFVAGGFPVAGLVDADFLDKMKPGTILINAARGNLVDEDALAERLKSGHIAGAGFDVFAVEPANDNPLIALNNFFASPHIGATTVESWAAMLSSAASFLSRQASLSPSNSEAAMAL